MSKIDRKSLATAINHAWLEKNVYCNGNVVEAIDVVLDVLVEQINAALVTNISVTVPRPDAEAVAAEIKATLPRPVAPAPAPAPSKK